MDDKSEIALFSVKENGSACHISCRTISIQGKDCTLLFCGSKKVHMAFEWTEDAQELERVMLKYGAGGRFDLVVTMLLAVHPLLVQRPEALYFLDEHRLVMNGEFLLPRSSGPVDNGTVHGLKQPTLFCFSLVVNQEACIRGLELCVEPVYALEQMNSWGFRTVK